MVFQFQNETVYHEWRGKPTDFEDKRLNSSIHDDLCQLIQELGNTMNTINCSKFAFHGQVHK